MQERRANDGSNQRGSLHFWFPNKATRIVYCLSLAILVVSLQGL